MRNIIASLAIAAVFAASAGSVLAATKPASSWQTFYIGTGQLVVREAGPQSTVVFDGCYTDYTGFATEPAAPTNGHVKKQSDLRAADELEREGEQEQAQALRDKWNDCPVQ